jgi:hypothetical protein
MKIYAYAKKGIYSVHPLVEGLCMSTFSLGVGVGRGICDSIYLEC